MYDIAIIGAGVIGLTCAVELQKSLGHALRVTIYAEEISPNTTGDISAGLWTPYLLQNTPMSQTLMWAKETQSYFHHLWRSGLAEEAGISLLPMMEISSGFDAKTPAFGKIAYGYEPMGQEHLDKIGKENNTTYRTGYTYVSFTCEPTKFLPFLMKEFLRNGGNLIKKRINRFVELKDFDVIINCTGFNARYLADDDEVKPIRGQIARVNAPWQFHVLFSNGNYIIPNTNCVVLGGTHQENDYDLNVRKEDTDFILTGCGKLVPALKKAEVIKHMVGLRPGRNEVRFCIIRKMYDGKSVLLFHNYGHGGSGVTLCYGSARNATRLLKRILNIKTQTTAKM